MKRRRISAVRSNETAGSSLRSDQLTGVLDNEKRRPQFLFSSFQFLFSNFQFPFSAVTARVTASGGSSSDCDIVQRFASRKALLDAVPIPDALFAELPAEINLLRLPAGLESPPIPYRDPSPRIRFVESRPPSGSIARQSFRAELSCGSAPRKAEASRPAS